MRKHLLLLCAIVLVTVISAVPATTQVSKPSTAKPRGTVKSPAAPLESFAGFVNVGVGEDITSLTNPGGLFDRMNAGTLSGNLIVNITSDLTAETGAVMLNQQDETGAGGYSVLIRPSSGARVVEGSSAAFSLITLQGADRVVIDGTMHGGKGLTIRNKAFEGRAAIGFVGHANDNAVIGCVLESLGTSHTGVVAVAVEGYQSANNSIVGNTISESASEIPVSDERFLVTVYGGVNTVVANNFLAQFGQDRDGTAFYAWSVKDLVLGGNVIAGQGPSDRWQTGVEANELSGTSVLSRNVIRDITAAEFYGFWIGQNRGSAEITGNRVYNINRGCDGCSSGEFRGVEIRGTVPDSIVKIRNNTISYDPLMLNTGTITGINAEQSAGSMELWHNTVLMSGTSPQVTSWGFRFGVGSAANVSMFGNIFFNDRIGGGNSFAVGDQSNGAGTWESDYNMYIGAGVTEQNYFDMGTEYFGTPVDFASWRTGSQRDAHSIAAVAGSGPFTAENLFVSASDLHLNDHANNPAVNAAGGVVLPFDIDGQVRPFGGAPDIGADEAGAGPAATRNLSGRVTTADGRAIPYARVTVLGGGLTEPVTLLTGAFGYFSFDGLRSDEVYLVAVDAKRYDFWQPYRILKFVDSDVAVDFTAIQ